MIFRMFVSNKGVLYVSIMRGVIRFRDSDCWLLITSDSHSVTFNTCSYFLSAYVNFEFVRRIVLAFVRRRIYFYVRAR